MLAGCHWEIKNILASGAILVCFPAMNEAERLTQLEERYAHLQRHSTEQDKVMLGLSEEVAKLRRELAKLQAQRSGNTDGEDLPHERPPHY